jgi:hypothetical protein
MDWAEERALRVVDEMLEYVRLRATSGAKGKADYGVAHTFIAQALREAEARGAERPPPAETLIDELWSMLGGDGDGEETPPPQVRSAEKAAREALGLAIRDRLRQHRRARESR